MAGRLPDWRALVAQPLSQLPVFTTPSGTTFVDIWALQSAHAEHEQSLLDADLTLQQRRELLYAKEVECAQFMHTVEDMADAAIARADGSNQAVVLLAHRRRDRLIAECTVLRLRCRLELAEAEVAQEMMDRNVIAELLAWDDAREEVASAADVDHGFSGIIDRFLLRQTRIRFQSRLFSLRAASRGWHLADLQ